MLIGFVIGFCAACIAFLAIEFVIAPRGWEDRTGYHDGNPREVQKLLSRRAHVSDVSASGR